MAKPVSVREAGGMSHTADDWQAQLEEVLALQSIFADNFRVIHIPGQKLSDSPNSNTSTPLFTRPQSPDSHGSRNSSSSSSSSEPSTCQDVEQLIESLIGSQPPESTAEGLLTFEAIVEVELPAGQLHMVLDMQDNPQQQQQQDSRTHNTSSCKSQQGHNSSSSSSKMPFGPPIRYLPPFCVQLTLPQSYPSSAAAPPTVVLQACWLSQHHEQQLQQQLQEIWQQQGPGPICFTWLEHLKSESLSDLGLVKELVLQQQQQGESQSLQQKVERQCCAAHGQAFEGPAAQQQQAVHLKAEQEDEAFQHHVLQAEQPQQQQEQHKTRSDSDHAEHRIPVGPRPHSSSVANGYSSNRVNHSSVDTAMQQTSGHAALTPRSSLRAAAAPFSPGQAVVPVAQQQRQQQSQYPQQQQQQRQRRSKGGQHIVMLPGNKPKQQQNSTVWQPVSKQQQQQQHKSNHHRVRCNKDSMAGNKCQQPAIQHAAQQPHAETPQQQHHYQQQHVQQQQDCDDSRAQHAHDSGQQTREEPTKQQQQENATEQQQQAQQQQQQQQVNAAEQLAVRLLRYSAAREAEAFRDSTHTCSICFEQVPGSDCLQLPDCGHFYCLSCLKHHAAAQMEQGAVENMRCPEPSCRRPFQPYVIKELLGEAGYARWEELLLQRTLDKMEDVVYCPRCDTVCIEDPDHCAQCSNCLYVFCSFCSDSWHPGTDCLDPHERLRILERRKKATGAGEKHHEMDLVNQLMNLKYLSNVSRKCPSCGMATIKNEGCNKMTCVYCGSNWCWKCQQVIQGYDHFRDSRCNMFDQEEINRWNAMMWANERAREVEMGQFHMQVRLQQNPEFRVCRCPVCGQENLREGRNNLLRCWSCNCHFCYSCRSWLRGKVGQHFVGPKACKQHGD